MELGQTAGAIDIGADTPTQRPQRFPQLIRFAIGLIVLLLSTGMLALIWGWQPAWLEPRAALQVVRVQPDLKAAEGDTIHPAYRVVNLTQKPVMLLGLATHCGCVSGSRLPVTVLPGGSYDFVLNVAVGKPGADGVFRSSANLFTDADGTFPSLAVEVSVTRGPTRSAKEAV